MKRTTTRGAAVLLLVVVLMALTAGAAWAEDWAAPDTSVGLRLAEAEQAPAGLAFSQEQVASINEGALLAAQNPTLVQTLYDGMKAITATISVQSLGVTVDQLTSCVSYMLYCYPELFAVSRYSYSYSGTTAVSVTPIYKLNGVKYYGNSLTSAIATQLRAQIAEYETNLNVLLALAEDDWTDLQTMLFYHDYLATHFEYDTTYTNYDAYVMMRDGKAVCQGYTELYRALLNAFDIENAFASSTAMNHIWNLVKLNGQWYHIDNTWDDPTADQLGRANHNNFLRSNAGIYATGHSNDYVSVIVDGLKSSVTSTTYDSYFWQNVDSAFVPTDAGWYYIYNDLGGYYDTADDGIFLWNGVSVGGGTLVYNISDLWRVYGNSSSYYDGTYSGLSDYYGRLVFNRPGSIGLYNPQTGAASTVATVSGGYAYGSQAIGSTLYYHRMNDANGTNAVKLSLTLPAVPVSAVLTSQPTQRVYPIGGTLNPAGLTATVTFSDGTTQSKAASYFDYTYDFSSTGSKTVGVCYDGFQLASFSATVMTKSLSAIAVKTNPSQTAYYVGDTLATAGLTLTATYNTGETETVSSGFTCSPTALTSAGTKIITVSYQGKTCTFTVNVTAVALSSIAVKTDPTKTEYFVGDTLDTAGLTLTGTNNNGSTQTISSGFTCSPTSLTSAGTKIITVSYQGKTCTFTVNVTAVALSSIAVKTDPTKTEYYVGDTLDTSGLTLTATYNNGSMETVSSGFACAPTALTGTGQQTITVSYGGQSCTFTVNVSAYVLTGEVSGTDLQVKIKQDGSFTAETTPTDLQTVLVLIAVYDIQGRLCDCAVIANPALTGPTSGQLSLGYSVKVIALDGNLVPLGEAMGD